MQRDFSQIKDKHFDVLIYGEEFMERGPIANICRRIGYSAEKSVAYPTMQCAQRKIFSISIG